jgi:hypothetical protein
MSGNSDNIRGAFSGTVVIGRKGATSPVNPVAAWDPLAFTPMGWITDDGITAARSREIQKVMAMGVTNAPVWSRITSQESTTQCTLMETKAEIIALFNNISTADMVSTPAVTGGSPVPQFITMIEQAVSQPAEYSLGIDLTDGVYLYRRFYPRVNVSETGDEVYVTTDPLGRSITFEHLIGSDGTIGKHMWANMALPAAAFPLQPA